MAKMILFQSGNAQFALEKTSISDIQPTSVLCATALPQQQQSTIEYQGKTLKMIDLAASLNHRVSAPQSSEAKVLMVKGANGSPAVALWADDVTGVLDAEAQQMHELPPIFAGLSRAYFPSVLCLDDRLALVCDTTQVERNIPQRNASTSQAEKQPDWGDAMNSPDAHPVKTKKWMKRGQRIGREKLEALIEGKIHQMVAGRIQQVLARMTAETLASGGYSNEHRTRNATHQQTDSAQVGQTAMSRNQAAGQVLIFPARIPKFKGKQVYYLFSLRQVVDVLRQTEPQPVPFGPQYVEGVAEWRGRVLPVLSLEQCLGIETSDNTMPLRTIVVRNVYQDKRNQPQELYAIFKVGAAVRQLDLPLDCKPITPPAWISHASTVSGLYEMEKNILLVINLENVLGMVQAQELQIESQER